MIGHVGFICPQVSLLIYIYKSGGKGASHCWCLRASHQNVSFIRVNFFSGIVVENLLISVIIDLPD